MRFPLFLSVVLGGAFFTGLGAGEARAATCSIPTACYLAANSGTGPGLEGTSAGSYGVWGITTFNSTSGSMRGYGVYGQDRSSNKGKLNFGVIGTSTYGTAVGGISTYGNGVSGVSTDAGGVYGASAATTGVYGVINSPAAPSALGTVAGVFGLNNSGNKNVAGVIGKTASAGYGMAAFSGNGALGSFYASATTGNAIEATAVSGTAVSVQSTSGGDGVDIATVGGGDAIFADAEGGNGIYSQTSGSDSTALEALAGGGGTALSATATLGAPAAVITSDNKGGSDGQYLDFAEQVTNSGINDAGITAYGDSIGVFSQAGQNGYPFYAGPLNFGVFYVDSSGDLYYAGTLTSRANASGGRKTTVYAPQATAPTLEDVGSGQLVAGRAEVRLGPEFAASLDPHAAYHVFLTPEADSLGLYVTEKTSHGFSVRENQAGRGTFAFDYRVVGTSMGNVGKRSAFVARGDASAPFRGLRLRPIRVAPRLRH